MGLRERAHPVWYRVHPVDVRMLLDGAEKALRNLHREADVAEQGAISAARVRHVSALHRQAEVPLGRNTLATLIELWRGDCTGRDDIEDAYLDALEEEFAIQAAARTPGRETEPGPMIADTNRLTKARTSLALGWGQYVSLSRRWPLMFGSVSALTSSGQQDYDDSMDNDDIKSDTDIQGDDDVIRDADGTPVAVLMSVEEAAEMIHIGIFTSRSARDRALRIVAASRPYSSGPVQKVLPLNL